MSPSQRIQIAVYRIENTLFDGMSNGQIVEIIVSTYNSKVPEYESFLEQELREGLDLQGFSMKVYYSEKNRVPKWQGFLRPILNEDVDLLSGRNKDVSFVAFVFDENNLFAVSGGQGNFIVQDYINQNFGIEIISRIISENAKVIRSLNERGLTGAVLASTKYFRFDYKLADDDEFGKLYKQIRAELDNEMSERLGFSADEIRKHVGCIAKSTFQISKSIDFSSLIRVLKNIASLLEQEPNFILNKVKIIARRGEINKALIEQLENRLYDIVVNNWYNRNPELDFDICHPEYEAFFNASDYNLLLTNTKTLLCEEPYDELTDFSFVFDALDKQGFDITQVVEIRGFLKRLRVRSYDSEGNVLTEATLIKHLHGELHLHDKIYFLIDGEWYEVENDFIDRLNRECEQVINESLEGFSLEPWLNNYGDEDQYNQQYVGEPDFLVMHKIYPDGFEIADIVKSEGINTYLIHVKKGFNNSMRELASQLAISARIVQEAQISGDFQQIIKVYEGLEEKVRSDDHYFSLIGNQTEKISKDQFLNLFKGKNIIFCLAFYDIAKVERDIVNIDRFDSNIAKFSLIELYRRLKSAGIKLRVIQIRRENPLKQAANL
ncbi:hypothetical protein DEAC_c23030 [Desulfosporosinus acididurans]|uniref:Sporadically distributed protein, TIGR04141 family n=1 Tax=Desulfosporosinus acididurans TaxID=476652 RepID=A0A0J1FRQ8_9FIRM|nr:DUF6119 family protein [Desulfosporosinus acididurans]KLU65673.1 hypothetical protein DEAC_c23030 [Desulfosporosinus acididurans]